MPRFASSVMRRDDERGVALLLALLVLALLVALILEFDAEARREYRDAAAFRDQFKARTLTRAAVQAARAVLQQDFIKDKRANEAYDAPTDVWAFPIKNYAIGDGFLSAQIDDERGKLNLNDLAGTFGDELQRRTKIQRFKRLYELLQINPDLVDSLVDWIDPDENQEAAGAESLYYQVQRPPYKAANAALPSLGDLRLIKGYTPEVIDKLSRYVTVFPNEGGSVVNINTADPLVIQALDHRITQTMATEIVQGRPYKKKEDLDRIGSFQQIGAELRASQGGYDVRSDFFSARLSVTVNEVTKTALVVLRRDPAKGESSLVSLRML